MRRYSLSANGVVGCFVNGAETLITTNQSGITKNGDTIASRTCTLKSVTHRPSEVNQMSTNSMFGKTVHEESFGPFSYQIKSPKRGEFTLWLGGCRIGKPNDQGEVWQFTAKTLREAKLEMRASALREVKARISTHALAMSRLRSTLEELEGKQ
jgi:hypothetical protein